MSIKSMTLISSLFLILSFHSSPVWAAPSVDDEIEAAESARNMAPLQDPNRTMLQFSEVEQTPSKLSMMITQTRVQKALDNQDITTGLMPSLESKSLVEEYETLRLAKEIGFLPTGIGEVLKLRHTLKDESWAEKVQKALDKMGAYYESDFWNEQLLN